VEFVTHSGPDHNHILYMACLNCPEFVPFILNAVVPKKRLEIANRYMDRDQANILTVLIKNPVVIKAVLSTLEIEERFQLMNKQASGFFGLAKYTPLRIIISSGNTDTLEVVLDSIKDSAEHLRRTFEGKNELGKTVFDEAKCKPACFSVLQKYCPEDLLPKVPAVVGASSDEPKEKHGVCQASCRIKFFMRQLA